MIGGMMQELERFAQTWCDLGYPEIALCVHDFLSHDEELREKAYDILCDIDHSDSGIGFDYRYAAQECYIKFLWYLFKESNYDQGYHLKLMLQSGGPHDLWSQEEKDRFEDLLASMIDELEQYLDVPEWRYDIFAIFSYMPRYRERLAPLLLNSPDEMRIMPFYLARLMVKPLSNLHAYVDYFRKYLSSSSEAIRKLSEEIIAKLLAAETI
jgi:hypothetical protein